MLEKLKGWLHTNANAGNVKSFTIAALVAVVVWLLYRGERRCDPAVICVPVEVRDTLYIERDYVAPDSTVKYRDVVYLRPVHDTIVERDSIVRIEKRTDTVYVTLPHNIYRDTIFLDTLRELRLLHRVDGFLRKSEFTYINHTPTMEERPILARKPLPRVALYGTLQSDGVGLRPGLGCTVEGYMFLYDYNVNTRAHSVGVGVRLFGL